MTEAHDAASPAGGSPAYVAPMLPPTAPAPEPIRRINLFKAFLLFWLLPKRFGPHLAAGAWWRAFVAHLLSIVIATGILAAGPLSEWAGERLGEWNRDLTLHTARVLLADIVLKAAVESATLPWSGAPAVGLLGAFPLLQLLILIVATLAMPWAAGGDRASSVWKRSVKNAYWSTTFAVPAAVAYVVLSKFDWVHMYPFEIMLILVSLAAVGLGVVLLVRMLTAGAHRYVGDPDGPAFAPREPTCDECGYAIVHLLLETRCPECGLPVRASLPGGRRQPTDWHEYELRPRGFKELLRLQWVVLGDPGFFRRLPVHSGITSARHFWWGTFLLMVFTTLLVLRLLVTVIPRPLGSPISPFPPLDAGAVLAAVFALPVLFGLQAAVMFLTCLWAQVRCGLRDYRVSAIVCYFASPLMWPLVPITLVGVTVLSDPVASSLNRGITFLMWGETIGLALLVAVGLLLIASVLAVLFWIRRLVGALTAARYANV